jgi:hypothetical protein
MMAAHSLFTVMVQEGEEYWWLLLTFVLRYAEGSLPRDSTGLVLKQTEAGAVCRSNVRTLLGCSEITVLICLLY